MRFNNAKLYFVVSTSLFTSFVGANPVPAPELDKRVDCWLNYIPACCSFMTWTSWPSIVPGLSSGCTPLASHPGGVCPAGARASGCCREHIFNDGELYYQPPNNQVYCYGT